MNEALRLLREAEISHAHGSYLASLVSSWTALETALRATIRKVPGGRPRVYHDLSEVIAKARAVGIITSPEQCRLRSVTHARNAAAHSGRRPSKNEARMALEIARELLHRLAEERGLGT